jgi:signal transduction histidine kinase
MAGSEPESERAEALVLLASKSPHERLKAARTLRRLHNSEDIAKIRTAIKTETVSWVRRALSAALTECNSVPELDAGFAGETAEITERVRRELYGKATQEVTGILLHEIEPVVGLIRTAASEELPDRSNSQTWGYLEYLKKILQGIQALRIASSTPNIEEFDLARMIAGVVDAEIPNEKTSVSLVGAQPLLCTGDPSLLTLALGNGLRNALDALDGTDPKPKAHAIIVAWGQTDIDYWITVIDKGRGLEIAREAALNHGKSTKKGHPGMGLRIARRAMDSIEGTANLEAREDGTHFELRWMI